MEKQRNTTATKSCKRLLIIVAFISLFSHPFLAQNFSSKELSNLQLVHAGDYTRGQKLFSNTDITFEVIIPFFNPSQIEIETPISTLTEIYKTVKCVEDYSTTNAGSRIEVSINFPKKGNFNPRPLKVKIGGILEEIPFEKVQIDFNPDEQPPVLIIQFSDGTILSSDDAFSGKPVLTVPSRTKLRFTASLQYIVQLQGYNWELPENSMFRRIREHDFTQTKYIDKAEGPKVIPVCDFEWTVLKEGLIQFPDLDFQVTGYNGCKVSIKFPNFYVEVTPNEETKSNKENSIFSSAFEADDSDYSDLLSEPIPIMLEDCEKLCALRSIEKKSLSYKAKKQRIELEKKLGLPSDQGEFPIFFFYLAITLFAVSAFLLILNIRRKEIIKIIILSLIISGCFAFILFSITKIKTTYAISKGCTILSIPEEMSESKSEIPAGNRVEVKEKSGSWVYISLGETGGWCNKDNILIIK